MIFIDGKKIQKEILETIKKETLNLDFQPIFCDVLVGEDPASAQYVRMKAKIAESVGIKFHNANFTQDITTEDLVLEVEKLNKIPNMCGIIVQLPLPRHIDTQKVLDAISPELDVDCLGSVLSTKFYSGEGGMGYPTALATMILLDSLDLVLEDKNIVVLGQGPLVGKPVVALLKFRGLLPEVITSQTENKEEKIKNADIIISAIGKGKYLRGEMLKDGAVVIDAGTSEMNGGIVGDVDLDSVKNMNGFVSPVPGGLGPVTVAVLLKNVLTVAKNLK